MARATSAGEARTASRTLTLPSGVGVPRRRGWGASVVDTRIGGNLQLDRNRGELRIHRNEVGGNLQANDNRGGLSLSRNRVGGNLQCEHNHPWPRGGGNRVRGNQNGQCAHL